MNLVRFSIQNPLIVNLSLLFLIGIGIIAWYALPREVFPVVDLDLISIKTSFSGASPLEVERQVTTTIEEAFTDSQDIDYISSTSSEGNSSIILKLKPSANVEDVMNEARSVLDRIDTLPELADPPELTRIRTRFPVITLTLYGDVSNEKLYKYAEQAQTSLRQIPGVAGVSKAGVRDWEIWVEVDPQQLAALKISLEEINHSLRNNLLEQPGGSIKAAEGDIRLRGIGSSPEIETIKEIILRTNTNGGKIKIGDIAKVSYRFEEAKTYARFNGAPSINLTVTKTAKGSMIEIAEQVKILAHQLSKQFPVAIKTGYHTDLSIYVKVRLNTVKSSGLIGLVLVLLSLYALLNFRIALITAFGIPFSFLFTIILLYYFDYTINMISLFAFLIVLGMIVDDAIIVTENIYRHIENGVVPKEAAQIGSQEVFWPIVVSTFTTISAFLPMLTIGGTLGTFISVIPIIVCCALFGSLIEAFLVLPSHARHLLKKQNSKKNILWGKSLFTYRRLLHWTILNRYLVIVAAIGILCISLSYAATRLPFQLFGNVETGQFFVNIETPNTYSLENSLELAKDIEKQMERLMNEDDKQTIITNIGVSIVDFNRNKTGSNLIQFVVDLKKPVASGWIEKYVTPLVSFGFKNFGERKRETDEIVNSIRRELAIIPGVQRLQLLKTDAGPAGDDIEIGITGDDLTLIRDKAVEISAYLKKIKGVQDVTHDQDSGKLEYQYTLNERGKLLGLTQTQLADSVRTGYLGNKVVYITRGNQRVPIRVIYPDSIRTKAEELASLPIVVAEKGKFYMKDIADIDIGRSINQIRRQDQKRMAKVTANVDAKIITASTVITEINRHFEPSPADQYTLVFLGEKKDFEDSFQGIKYALMVALSLIFFMLAALFGSLRDPLVIIAVVPFGLIGVIAGHALFDYHLQFLSVIGILALSGIIVNDSLILVDFIKQLRKRGIERVEAVVSASCVRARPIILTTITTFLGVSPLIFFATGQTAFLSPMAVSLGFGLVFATMIILITLPCLYLIVDDLNIRMGYLIQGSTMQK